MPVMDNLSAKNKRVINIMVCSPSDVQFEREKAFQLIHEWNRENINKDIVLVPIGFEDVAKSFAKKDPQEIINKQIVSMSDMAVVILWSTLGRKDADGVEYTISEINNHITNDLPTILFFSNAPLAQDCNFDEFKKVREFRKHPEDKLKNNITGESRTCMYVEYASQDTFPEKFKTELNRAVNEYFVPKYYSDVSDSNSITPSTTPIKIENSDLSDLQKVFTFPSSFVPNESQKQLWKQFVKSIKSPVRNENSANYIEFGHYPQQHIVIDPSHTLMECIKSDAEGSVFEDKTTKRRFFKPHRINLATYASRYSYSDGTKVSKMGEHYFQIQPIKWLVLKRGRNSSLLLSEQILDWHHFLEPNLIEPQGNMILSTVDGCPNGTRANNWEWSTLRTWLETYFICNAFSDNEQKLIVSKEVSNSPDTGCIDEQSEAIKMQCGKTKNKAFILSYADTINPNYGFNSDPMSADPLRIAPVTDFAIARGVKPSRSPLHNNTLVGWWWLRSPANYKMYYAYTGHKYDGSALLDKDVASAKEAAQCRVCDVMHDGHVCTRGSIVDGAFIISAEESCDGTANGVRIAIEVSNSIVSI